MTSARTALSRWITANTLIPSWMMGRWPQPAASYLASALIQVIAVIAAAALLQAFPTFRFPEALPILAVVLVALTCGAGPGILAMFVGVALLDVVILSPSFALSLARAEDVVSVPVARADARGVAGRRRPLARSRRGRARLHTG